MSDNTMSNNTMSNNTFTTHEEVIDYIWSIDKNIQNHTFYINTKLYRLYANRELPQFVKFCSDYNLSVGYTLHTNRHPVIMNYYNPDSERESDYDDESDDESDTAPLIR